MPASNNEIEMRLEPRRVKGFARYFKEYMGIGSLIVAALPIPVTASRLIPIFRAYREPLSVYTTLFCFLLLGFIFYSRHRLARMMFWKQENGTLGLTKFAYLPLLLILACLASVAAYHALLNVSVAKVAAAEKSTADTLEAADPRNVPYGPILILLYLNIFLTAEGAFILMATKEYLQDVIGLKEADLYVFALANASEVFMNFTANSSLYDGAAVRIDDKFAGYLPFTCYVKVGEHELEIRRSGSSVTQRIQVEIKPSDNGREFRL